LERQPSGIHSFRFLSVHYAGFTKPGAVRPRFSLREVEAYAAIALPVGIFHDPQPKRSDPGTSKRRFA
jgi:hypothetical protein